MLDLFRAPLAATLALPAAKSDGSISAHAVSIPLRLSRASEVALSSRIIPHLQ